MKKYHPPEKQLFNQEIFNKILKMVETSDSIPQLQVCKNYFEQFKTWYFVSLESETLFERKFVRNWKIALREKTKEENNE